MRPGSVELLLYYPKIQLRLHSLSSRDWSWVMGPLPDFYGVPELQSSKMGCEVYGSEYHGSIEIFQFNVFKSRPSSI